MAVGVSCSDALAEGLETSHPIAGKTVPRTVFWPGSYLDPTSGMVPGPALPERPAVTPGGGQGRISGDRGRAILFPTPPVLADRDDRGGLTVDDRGVAAAGVIRTIGGHAADLLILGDLVEQFRQNRTVTVGAESALHGADVRRGRVHGQMHLAPLAAIAVDLLAVRRNLPCFVDLLLTRSGGT